MQNSIENLFENYLTNQSISELQSYFKNIKHKKPIIIGFSGPAGSGKSTACSLTQQILKDNYCIESVILNFADELKHMCYELFPLADKKSFWGSQEDKLKPIKEYNNITGRHIMQTIGTDIMRNHIDSFYWVKSFEKELIKNINNKKIILIGDVRFENEIDIIHKWNGIVIKLESISTSNSTITHISEESLPYNLFDGQINNYPKSIDNLEKNIITLLNKYILY